MTSKPSGVTVRASASPPASSAATGSGNETVEVRIAVWASHAGEQAKITAKAADKVKGSSSTPLKNPAFNVGCGSTTTSCTVSSLPTKKPATSQAGVAVILPKETTSGHTVTVTFDVAVSAQASSTHSAKRTRSSRPESWTGSGTRGSHHTTGSGSGAGTAGSGAGMAGAAGTIHGAGRTPYSVGQSLNPGTLPLVSAGAAGTTGVPRAAGLGGVPGTSTRIPAGSASHLFPKINPGSAPSPAPRTPAPKRRALDQEATFPMSLGSSEFGAQIVGLIALVLAVAIAVTRISLRRSRAAAGRPGTGQ